MIRATMLAAAMALAACATATQQPRLAKPAGPASAEVKAAEEQDKKDQAKMICTWEKPIGSNIPEKVCRSPEQIEEEREATQRAIQTSQPGSPMRPGG